MCGPVCRRYIPNRLATPTTLGHQFVEAGINFVKAESITDSGNFIREKFAKITEETHLFLRRSIIESGDVLCSIAGNYEHLTFLATYVVPLIGFDFKNGQYMFVFGLLLIVMGLIYIKTDLFYQNPSLALLGFHIFQADGSFKNGDRTEIILISRGRIAAGQKVSYIKLDDRIYYVSGTK